MCIFRLRIHFKTLLSPVRIITTAPSCANNRKVQRHKEIQICLPEVHTPNSQMFCYCTLYRLMHEYKGKRHLEDTYSDAGAYTDTDIYGYIDIAAVRAQQLLLVRLLLLLFMQIALRTPFVLCIYSETSPMSMLWIKRGRKGEGRHL